MVAKWPIIPKIVTPTFYGIEKDYETQKVARVKGSNKKKRKGQEKYSKRAISSPNLGLYMR